MLAESIICVLVAKELVYNKIEEAAYDFGVPKEQLMYIIKNEAAKTRDGDYLPCGDGDLHLTDPTGKPHQSRGVAQINKYFHPDVRDIDAYNYKYAIEWTASRLREGKCSMWTTCRAYNKLYGKT